MTGDDRSILYEGKFFTLLADAVHGEVVRCGNEVLVVALDDDGQVILTVEPSAAFPEPTVILPGGSTSPGRSNTETANLELQEEAGLCAARLDFLGELRPFSKYLTVRTFVYLARDLVPNKLAGDEAYVIDVERVPLTSFESLIAAGHLLDARVIAALHLARAFLDREARSLLDAEAR